MPYGPDNRFVLGNLVLDVARLSSTGRQLCQLCAQLVASIGGTANIHGAIRSASSPVHDVAVRGPVDAHPETVATCTAPALCGLCVSRLCKSVRDCFAQRAWTLLCPGSEEAEGRPRPTPGQASGVCFVVSQTCTEHVLSNSHPMVPHRQSTDVCTPQARNKRVCHLSTKLTCMFRERRRESC